MSAFWQFSVALGLLIIALPTFRAVALCYALLAGPAGLCSGTARKGGFPAGGPAAGPWSMAEIFVIGVAVALVKVSGLASVTLGPAFWSFVAAWRGCVDGGCGACVVVRSGT